MVDLPTLERTISGKGLIKIPEEYRRARRIFLYVDLIRPPSTSFKNFTFNPPKAFYGHVTFNMDGYVLEDYDVNYDQQVFEIFSSQPSQNLVSLICALENILDSFVQYAVASAFPFFKNNSIYNHGHISFLPDSIKFRCYADCALRLVLKGQKLDLCAENQGEPSPPPPPPPPPTTVPPGTPINVDPPYEGEDDGGDTVPSPIDDDPVTPPFGEACAKYRVTISAAFRQSGAPDQPVTQDFIVWGVVGTVSIVTVATQFKSAVVLQCQGLFPNPCAAFTGYDTLVVEGTPNSDPLRGYVNATIDNIVVEP